MVLHIEYVGMTTSIKTARQCKLHWFYTVILILGEGLLAIQLSNYYVNVDHACILFLSEEKISTESLQNSEQFPLVPGHLLLLQPRAKKY